MTVQKHLYWFLYLLFLLSCARQSSPTGGPKDTIPPVLQKSRSIPLHESTNFKGKEIHLEFDEMVIVTNPKEQIIITPSVGKNYKVIARNKVVTLTLEKELEDSTTYSFNFRDAVQDITEKNPVVNLKLAFSTGSYVDSLSIAGKVFDPLKNKDIKGATIALFQNDTFNIFQHTPVYITKSDEKGNYSIENLKPGKYFIYAIDDKNRNLIADSKTEAYGFRTDSIDLRANQKNINIANINLDARVLKLTNARPYNTYFNIKTSKNLAGFRITAPSGETAVASFGEDRANIRVYNTFDPNDSTAIRLQATDSINNRIDTVLYAKFSKRDVKPEAFTASAENFRVLAHKGIISGRVKFNKPLLSIHYDSILYRIDSAKTVTFTAENMQWDSLNNRLTLEKKFDKALLAKPETPDGPIPQQPEQRQPTPKTGENKKQEKPIQHQLYLAKGSFISIELDTATQIAQDLKPLTLEQTGIIFTQIQTTEPHFIVQLLDKTYTVIHSVRDNKKATFEDIVPAEYYVRLIIDKNSDGQWSPGNFYQRVEPEPSVFYKNEKDLPAINLKANWEIGPLLITF